VETLFQEGIRPKGFVIVHEAPMALPTPDQVGTPLAIPEVTRPVPIRRGMNEPSVIAFVETFALGLASLMSAAVPFLLLPGLILLDPILIAITEEDTWIEIERWNVDER